MKKILIGRTQKVDLPLLGFNAIDAKIDTGAYSCSIHCEDVRIDKEQNIVHFRLLDASHPDYEAKEITMPIDEIKNVTSSNGHRQKRVFIKTKITLAGKTYTAQLSLTDREKMRYPMLIGRNFLHERYIVDVSLQYQ